jgi:hypothetical protein
LEKRIEVLEGESRRYEDDLEKKTIALEEEKEKGKAQDELLKDLKGKINQAPRATLRLWSKGTEVVVQGPPPPPPLFLSLACHLQQQPLTSHFSFRCLDWRASCCVFA